MEFSCDGNIVISGSLDWKIKIWNLISGIQIKELVEHRHFV